MRKIRSSPSFDKNLVKFLKRNPELVKKTAQVFSLLEKDPHYPTLGTHKLHGVLAQFFACKITYDYRLIFSFDDDCIYPHSIGSHDDVY